MSDCYNWSSLQNGTTEEVKKIVTILNEAEVPSEEVVGMLFANYYLLSLFRIRKAVNILIYKYFVDDVYYY